MAKAAGAKYVTLTTRHHEGFSLYDALTYCKDSLVQYGGHILAAGLSVENTRIDEFRNKINEYAINLERAVR